MFNLRSGTLLGSRSDSVFQLCRRYVRTQLRDLGVRELLHRDILRLLGLECMRKLFFWLLSIEPGAIKLRDVPWRKLLWRHGTFFRLGDLRDRRLLDLDGQRMFKLRGWNILSDHVFDELHELRGG